MVGSLVAMPRPRPAALAVLAFAALLAGCAPSSGSKNSAGDFRGDQRAVATTVEDLESAASDGDENRICRNLLAPALVRALGAQGGCAAAVDKAIKNADTFAIDVQSVRIAGNRATARVKFETGERDRFGTVGLTRIRQNAGWRIERLASGR
jgi:copper chaperone CopZ